MTKSGALLKQLLVSEFLAYDTPKIVQINSKAIGILNRIVQISIILYVIVWVFIFNHGYQYIERNGVVATTTKLKGIAQTNSSDDRVGRRIWDTTDLIVPPQMNGAIFITTNIIKTRDQFQGECAELRWSGADCVSDDDCLPVGKPFHLGHGVSTGECNNSTGTCMVRAWCPIENDSLPNKGMKATLEDSKDFTLFIKNHVSFPYYGKSRSNLIESIDKKYLRSCNYHPTSNPYCPIFRIGDIVSFASVSSMELSDTYFNEMAIKGGVISVRISWDCNFDRHEHKCKPFYAFSRLDNFDGNTIASGYNFRHAEYYRTNGSHTRDAYKAYGILLIISTEAQARAFNAVTFFLNFGSGLALLGVASVCCDFVLLYFHRKKEIFKGHIFHNVEQTKQSDEVLGKSLGSQELSSHQLISKTIPRATVEDFDD